jgi:hypothetical protein
VSAAAETTADLRLLDAWQEASHNKKLYQTLEHFLAAAQKGGTDATDYHRTIFWVDPKQREYVTSVFREAGLLNDRLQFDQARLAYLSEVDEMGVSRAGRELQQSNARLDMYFGGFKSVVERVTKWGTRYVEYAAFAQSYRTWTDRADQITDSQLHATGHKCHAAF